MLRRSWLLLGFDLFNLNGRNIIAFGVCLDGCTADMEIYLLFVVACLYCLYCHVELLY